MAGILVMGVALGLQEGGKKIKEKRDERKAKKAALHMRDLKWLCTGIVCMFHIPMRQGPFSSYLLEAQFHANGLPRM
ncbi:hypothetical protein N0V91_001019 [Didymella pomorum]|uniref:Uncharacterized protein n=1 Tax=Didymella pomorum TaxID=749634 RepID=A0A9W8ZMN2_9PLEO|nr:hypothetical protein N0V91_001019 [Didymella pomorum]